MLVDSLEAPPTLAEVLTPLFDVAQVIAAKDDNNRRVRIEQLLWRFTVKIEVKRLDPVASKQLTEAAIAENPPRFANERIRERFARHVAHSGGGVPAGILGMVAEAATEAEITPARAAAFSHDAARVYLDMTPLVIVALVVFVALRYVSRGIDSQELFVLSGGASALFMGARFAFALMRR